jgi:hypothetical protein
MRITIETKNGVVVIPIEDDIAVFIENDARKRGLTDLAVLQQAIDAALFSWKVLRIDRKALETLEKALPMHSYF